MRAERSWTSDSLDLADLFGREVDFRDMLQTMD